MKRDDNKSRLVLTLEEAMNLLEQIDNLSRSSVHPAIPAMIRRYNELCTAYLDYRAISVPIADNDYGVDL